MSTKAANSQPPHLEPTEARFSFFDQAHFGAVRVWLDGRQITANLALAQLNGYETVEELSNSVDNLAVEWYVEPNRRKEFLDLLYRDGQVKHFESEVYRHKTRERIWVSEDGWLVKDEYGQILYYEGTVVDITKRKHQELFQEALGEIVEDILRLGPQPDIYQTLLERIITIIPKAQAGSILLFDHSLYRYVATTEFDLSALKPITFRVEDMPEKHQARSAYVVLPKTLPVQGNTLNILETKEHIGDIHSTLCIPIVLGEHPLAIINLDNFDSEDAFSEQVVSQANVLAKQVATVLGRFQFEKAIGERQAVFEQSANFHHSLVDFMSSSLRQGQGQDFYTRLLHEAVKVVPGAQAGSILQKQGQRFYFIASVGFDHQELHKVSFNLEEISIYAGTPYRIIIRDKPISRDAERRKILDTAGRATDIKVSLSLPIKQNDEIVAFLFLDNFDTPEAFNETAINMSRIFAEQIGVLLSRFELEHSLSKGREAVTTWSNFYQGLMQLMNENLQQGLNEGFYQRLLERAVAVVPGAQKGSLVLKNRQGRYYFVASVGFDLEGLKKITFSEQDLLLDSANPAPQLINNYENYQSTDTTVQEILETSGQLRSLAVTLCIPIWTDKHLVSLLFLDNLENPKAFNSDAIRMAEGFARQVAILIQRLNLEQELRTRQEALARWSSFNRSLMQFSNEALRRGETETFYHDLLNHASSIIPGVEAGSILQKGPDGKYHFISALNFDLEQLKTITLEYSELFVNRGQNTVLLDNQTHYQDSSVESDRMDILKRAGRTDEIGSTLSAAVMVGGEMLAVLNLNSFHPHAFGLESKAMIETYAAQIAVLIQRLDLEQTLEQRNLELARLANYDTLTGLPNRSLFTDRLQQIVSNSSRQNHYAALMFLDLDGFKLVNDSLGHSMGDELLKKVANRLLHCVREDDTVARLGGDEFTIVLNSLKAPQDAIYIAEKVLQTLSQPFILKARELHIGASIGITLYPDDGHTVEELIQHADTAMYHAKSQGKNRYHFFTSELNTQACQQLKLENDMRRGLQQGEFYLTFQPRVHLQLPHRQIASVEALARWKHPELGQIQPDIFIPIAEKTNFIQVLGRDLILQACQQAKRWQEQGQFIRIAVNISVKQLQHGLLVHEIEQILQQTQLEAKWLELEITESAAISDIESTISTLQHLKDMGISISIDDFGTAYSSLNYLKRLPISSLKIDKTFIEDLTNKASGDTAIIGAVVAMGKHLGFTVIAEGVEHQDQLEFLRNTGCDEAQGYYFSRPVEANKALEWVNPQFSD